MKHYLLTIYNLEGCHLGVIDAETMTFFETCVMGVNVGHTYHAIL